MIKATKYALESFFVVGELDQHSLVKQEVLDLIDQQASNNLNEVDNYYSDRVSKLDWDNARNFQRPWIKMLKPFIEEYLNKLALALGYQSVVIEEMWFQQYHSGDTHGWHIHGSNFTGVYYLELNEQSPLTELIEPSTQNNKIIPNIKEGDVLIFPSYTIHRAPIITNDIRKTIVSFNFIVDLINEPTLNHINGL